MTTTIDIKTRVFHIRPDTRWNPLNGSLLDFRLGLLAHNKRMLIAARRVGDDEAAAIISQDRQKLKNGWCKTCGVAVSGNKSRHCVEHDDQRRGKSRQCGY
jgi:hypothetical protein